LNNLISKYIWTSPDKSRKVQKSPEKSRKVQKSPEKTRQVQTSTDKSRQVQKNPEKSRHKYERLNSFTIFGFKWYGIIICWKLYVLLICHWEVHTTIANIVLWFQKKILICSVVFGLLMADFIFFWRVNFLLVNWMFDLLPKKFNFLKWKNYFLWLISQKLIKCFTFVRKLAFYSFLCSITAVPNLGYASSSQGVCSR
jgi:K+-sensing histidine kinase KdpD